MGINSGRYDSENSPESTDGWSRNPDNPPEEEEYDEMNDEGEDE